MHHEYGQQTEPSEARVQSTDPCFDLCALNTTLSSPKVMVSVSIHGQPVDFEDNSRAACTLLGEKTFRATWPKHTSALHKPGVHPRTWSGEILNVLVLATVTFRYKNTACDLPVS